MSMQSDQYFIMLFTVEKSQMNANTFMKMQKAKTRKLRRHTRLMGMHFEALMELPTEIEHT